MTHDPLDGGPVSMGRAHFTDWRTSVGLDLLSAAPSTVAL
jgi:hypothetical protein